MALASNEVDPHPVEADVSPARVRFHPASLDWLNFLLADTQGALGPYLNVFLVTEQHWSQSAVGVVTTFDGVLGLLLRTPMGAIIDRTRSKRSLLALAVAVVALSAIAILAAPTFGPVLIANSAMALASNILGPPVAAITLGIVSEKDLARRLGRNAAFDHAGNVAIAIAAGAVGWAFG